MPTHLNINPKVAWIMHATVLLAGCVFLWSYFELKAITYYFYFGSFILLLGLHLFSQVYFSKPRSVSILKIIYLTLCCILILTACLHADNIKSYGPLVTDTVHAIYQTSLTEIIGYVYSYVSSMAIVTAISWICLTLLTGIFLSPIPDFSLRSISVLSTGFVIGALMVFFGKQDIAQFITEASSYQDTLSSFTKSRQQVLNTPGYTDANSDFEGNIIVVLGEASTRHHFGIYNYPRNTTPLLNEIKQELHIFTDIISSHSHTVPSLSDALTYSSRNETKNINEIADVINVAKKAQFHTTWFSNQNAVGIWDNLTTAIGRQADVIKFHDPASGTQRRRSVFDTELINTTRNFLSQNNNKKNLIFLHLMATHSPYCDVVPGDFATDFVNYDGIKMDYSVMGQHLVNTEKKIGIEGARSLMYSTDCYDKAVRYVDHTVRQLIESIREKEQPTILLYLSDHGEAPILGTGHDSRKHSHFHVEIPFFVWANDSYNKRYPVKIKNIEENTEKPGSLLDFSYYLSDIAMIKGPPEIDKRSIFSSSYEPFVRKTLRGKIGYDHFDKRADYSERTRANLKSLKTQYGNEKFSKVWAHRVNTIGAMIESRELFAGLEFDLVFDSEKQEFFVYHPPAPNVGLNLQTHLRQDNSKIKYWFDWKNANKSNSQLALNRLEVLDKIYNIKERVILESGILDNSLSIFQKAGWHTSYYLPTKKVLDCIDRCNVEEKTRLAMNLLDARKLNGYDTVSFDHRLLEFFDKYMDNALKKDNVNVYIWDSGINISDRSAMENVEKLINHNRVGVLLVNFPSPFDL